MPSISLTQPSLVHNAGDSQPPFFTLSFYNHAETGDLAVSDAFVYWAIAALLAAVCGLSIGYYRTRLSPQEHDPHTIRRYLTQRYLLAVSLIAVLAVTAYASITMIIASQESAATVINISGRQRMLSQRIALYATELGAIEKRDRQEVRDTLGTLIELMRASHTGLTRGDAAMGLPAEMSEAVRVLYFDTPLNLDRRVREYLELAERLLSLPKDQLNEDSPVLEALLSTSPDLLRDLNAAVGLYEREAQAKTDFLQSLELMVLVAVLITLLAEIVFIFRPMVGAVVSLHRDIDEKEKLLATFVKHTPAAVAMFDHEVRYLTASDRWYEDYGLKDRNIIGKSHYDIFPEIRTHHPQWVELHARALQGEVIKSEEEPFTRADGTVEWLRYELHPWQRANGEVGGLIMFTENITKRKQMEIMKDEFISTVNHELRTPLTSIQMSLGILQTTAMEELDAESQRVLTLAYENCGRLTHLVNDILDREKIAAGKIEYKLEDAEICGLVTEIIERHQHYANRYRVTFDLHCKIEEAYCRIDRSRFNQALVNLLSNASKFSPHGETVIITVEKKDENRLCVSVADKGCGVPESFKSRIFEKFAQADSSSTRTHGGTGLGLSITKSIIEAFDGEVGFDSEEGKGATFYFLLPLAQIKHHAGVAHV